MYLSKLAEANRAIESLQWDVTSAQNEIYEVREQLSKASSWPCKFKDYIIGGIVGGIIGSFLSRFF